MVRLCTLLTVLAHVNASWGKDEWVIYSYIENVLHEIVIKLLHTLK